MEGIDDCAKKSDVGVEETTLLVGLFDGSLKCVGDCDVESGDIVFVEYEGVICDENDDGVVVGNKVPSEARTPLKIP